MAYPRSYAQILAQTGLYTLFAKFVPNATFYVYEPYTPCYEELNENIKLNGITNVKTFNMAISDKKEKKVPDHKGLSTLGSNPIRFSSHKTFEVQCDTLDNIFYQTNTRVDFIKCDTEGWEYYVLQGGRKTLEKYHPVIQLEYHLTNMKQCGVSPVMFHQLISELGYINTFANKEEYIYEYKE